MFKYAAVLLLALVALSQASDQYTHQYSQTATQGWDFAQGGKVTLHMRCGDLRILPTSDSRISLSYTMHSNHSDFIGKVKPEFHVTASEANLLLEAPRNGNIDVELKVPARSNLYVRVFAGDISIGQIEGNQDVETHAGDIAIQMPEPVNYGLVEASTHAGDVSASFGKSKGWVGNSLKYDGPGQYRVHAHTFAGDIGFEEPKTAKLEEPCKCEK